MALVMQLGRNIRRYVSASSGASFPQGGMPRAPQGARCYSSSVPHPERKGSSDLAPHLAFAGGIWLMRFLDEWQDWRRNKELKQLQLDFEENSRNLENVIAQADYLKKLLTKVVVCPNLDFMRQHQLGLAPVTVFKYPKEDDKI